MLLQEVDQSSARTNRIDETAYYQQNTGLNAAYAINYQCGFVPFPLPPIGAVKSGVLTLSAYQPAQAQRQSPVSYTHLDVYKRQPTCPSLPSARPSVSGRVAIGPQGQPLLFA